MLRVPVKIIHTNSNDLISRVIRSTNRQTPVPDEAFASLEKFHKRLQDYYRSHSPTAPEVLLYERRSKEFLNTEGTFDRQRIINLHSQIRSFSAIILGEPHLINTRNPVTILKDLGPSLFKEDHIYSPYYLSSLMMFLFFKLKESGKIDGRYEISRYWICWIARMIASGGIDIGQINSAKTDQACEKIMKKLSNEDYLNSIFQESCGLYEKAKLEFCRNNGQKRNRELVKTREFRDTVKAVLSRSLSNQREG